MSEYSKQIVAGLAVALVAAIAIVAFAELGLPSQNELPANDTTTTPTASTEGSSSSGLLLRASLNATVLTQGQAIGVTATLFNTLNGNLTLTPDYSTYSNVTNWNTYSFDVCEKGQALTMAVFAGHLTVDNISGEAPLYVGQPYPIPCALYVPITQYVLLPNSSMAEAYQDPGLTGLPPTFTTNMTMTLTPFGPLPAGMGPHIGASGYWAGNYTGGQLQFQIFPLGTYTVAAADVWGNLVLLYFEVV